MEGIRHRATGIIVKDGKILLIKRVRNGQEYFVYPGGGVEDGEGVAEALKREMKEELNFEIANPKFLFDFPDDKGGLSHYYCYLIVDWSGELQWGGPEKERMDENNQYHHQWLTHDEYLVTENIFPGQIRDMIINIDIWQQSL